MTKNTLLQTEQYTLLTEPLYLTPASILMFNDLPESVFIDLLVQQSMHLLIEHLNYFQEEKEKKLLCPQVQTYTGLSFPELQDSLRTE